MSFDIEWGYVAEGISNEVPTGQIEDLVRLIDETIRTSTDSQSECMDEWRELRQAIAEREAHNARTGHPDDEWAQMPEATR